MPSGLMAAPRVAVASVLASTVGCGVPAVAAGLAVSEGSVACVVLLVVVAVLLWVPVVLRPAVFASPVVPGVPAAAASASSAGVAVPAVAVCGAAAVPVAGAWA